VRGPFLARLNYPLVDGLDGFETLQWETLGYSDCHQPAAKPGRRSAPTDAPLDSISGGAKILSTSCEYQSVYLTNDDAYTCSHEY
jgi:hypothetical protein